VGECLVQYHGELTDAKRAAGDAICDTGQPGELWLVDGEVGAGGPVQALLVEDFQRCGRRE